MRTSSKGRHSRRQADARELAALVPFTLVGLTLGVTLLVHLPRNTTLLALGLFVCVFALYVMVRRDAVRRLSRGWAVPAGIAGAVIGALFGMGAPPYVLYITGRIAEPAAQRATISQMVMLNVCPEPEEAVVPPEIISTKETAGNWRRPVVDVPPLLVDRPDPRGLAAVWAVGVPEGGVNARSSVRRPKHLQRLLAPDQQARHVDQNRPAGVDDFVLDLTPTDHLTTDMARSRGSVPRPRPHTDDAGQCPLPQRSTNAKTDRLIVSRPPCHRSILQGQRS